MKQTQTPSEERFQMTVAVHLILLRGDKVLLLRRYQTGYDDGAYTLVSGCIDGNETATQAMIREAKEEAGITLKAEWLRFSNVMHRRSDKWEGICFFFIADHWEGEIINGEPDKCDDIGFFPLEDLPENLIPYVREGMEASLEKSHPFLEHGWS